MKKLIVSILLRYLRFFAQRTLRKTRATVIGITGSAGKSSTREMLFTVLKDQGKTRMVEGNSETGIPLGILGFHMNSLGFETLLASLIDWATILCTAPFRTNYLKKIQYLIIEMGIDEPDPPKNMSYLLSIVKPDIALFLNAFENPVHSMQFEKILPEDKLLTDEEKRVYKARAIAAEKAKIITESGCKIGMYNGDNSLVKEALQIDKKTKKHETLFSFGTAKHNAISYDNFSFDTNGTLFSYTVNISDRKAKLSIKIPGFILPLAYRELLAATILTCLFCGVKPQHIVTSLQDNFTLPKSRASLLKGIKNTLLIDSSYNASPSAVAACLELMKTLKAQTKRHTVFIFGDMRELGAEAAAAHAEVAKHMHGIIDYIYLVGEQTREYVLPVLQENEAVYKEIRWFANSKYAGEYLAENLPRNALVLIKGSQNTIFLEEAIKYILADKTDEKKLCRQEASWLTKKQSYFGWKPE